MTRTLALLVMGAALLPARGDAAATTAPVRAAYFYHYMPVEHLDALAGHGLTRAIVHFIADTLRPGDAAQVRAFVARGALAGIEVEPQFLLDAPKRLATRPLDRRYTWGSDRQEPVACPLDSTYWRSALLDRAAEILAAEPAVRRISVDLELMSGSRRHYDAGACRCAHCLREFAAGRPLDPAALRRSTGLHAWQEERATRFLTALLREFEARHPRVSLGVFDLDFDSFVHRALARALARTGIAVTDYCERSYSVAGAPLPGARARLEALGLGGATLVGGLWLKRFTPPQTEPALRSILERSDGYFVFTSYSLWRDPAELTGPYTLPGAPAEYWNALREANGTP